MVDFDDAPDVFKLVMKNQIMFFFLKTFYKA